MLAHPLSWCSTNFLVLPIFTNFLWNLYAPFIRGSVSSIDERNASKAQKGHVGASGGFRLLRLLDSFSCPRLCTYHQLVTRRGTPSLPACCRHYPSYYRNPNSTPWRALPGFNGQEKQEARSNSSPQPRLATPISRKSNPCRKRLAERRSVMQLRWNVLLEDLRF